MRRAQQLLKTIREQMGGHVYWAGKQARLLPVSGRRWEVACGSRRYESGSHDAAIARHSGAALNFQIRGEGESVHAYEICVGWPAPASWLLMFHLDPDHERWPEHSQSHLQFQSPGTGEEPPFVTWRIPLGETEPERLIEFVVARLVERTSPDEAGADQP